MTRAKPLLHWCAVLIAIVVCGSSALATTEKVLYSFQGGSDGAEPYGPLVADAAGNLYGTTGIGGSGSCAEGCGTVFQLSLPAQPGGAWTKTVLYSFQGSSDGAAPESDLIFDAVGNLYGTTVSGGGKSFHGTVFELSPPAQPGGAWTETVLYRFQGGDDGKYPGAGLIFDQAGNLYGTTIFGGGRQNAGIAFELSPPAQPGGAWTETVLHRFGHRNDGLDPWAGVILNQKGAVYGTTITGTVFKLKPPAPGQADWTEKTIHRFHGGGDVGSRPCDLIRGKGALYGVTTLGGSPSNAGTIFQLSPPGARSERWKQTKLYSFTGGNDGGLPCGVLTADRHGNLYGVALGNGADIPGTVFKLAPPAQPGGAWTLTTLHVFGGGNDGFGPNGGVIFGKGGALYGTTGGGGASGNGTVFKVVP
jgi:uncharacterized repeat protein (TIGR03803 family)